MRRNHFLTGKEKSSSSKEKPSGSADKKKVGDSGKKKSYPKLIEESDNTEVQCTSVLTHF